MSDPLFERYKEALKAGHVAALRGRLDDALVQYRRAASIADERALPHASMGGVLLRMGRSEESFAAYTRALARSPRDEQSLAGLAEVLVSAGRSADAAEALERLAETVQAAGRAEEALATLRRALALNETERRRRHVQAVERLVQEQRDAAAAEQEATLTAEEAAAWSDEGTPLADAEAAVEASPAVVSPVARTEPPPPIATAGSARDDAFGPARPDRTTIGPHAPGTEDERSDASSPVAAAELPPRDRGEDAIPAPLPAAPEPSAAEAALPGPEQIVARAEALAGDDPRAALSAFLEAAEAYLGADAPSAAEDACQRALVLAPASPDVHLAFVRLYLAAGTRDLAADKLVLLERLLELDAGPDARNHVLSIAREAFPEDVRFQAAHS
jgi:tetratricopeptide (TPR) repeat protein